MKTKSIPAEEILKLYTQYLIEEYKKINSHYENSGIFCELNQFYAEGRIKDLIGKNDQFSKKSHILNTYRKDIVNFSNDFNLSVNILELLDFWNLTNRLLKTKLRDSKIEQILTKNS